MLYCVLIESPEVLNIIQENHIKSIISLLDKHGRNHKVGIFFSQLLKLTAYLLAGTEFLRVVFQTPQILKNTPCQPLAGSSC